MEGLFIVYLVGSVRVKQFGIVRRDLGFDEYDFVHRQTVALVKFGICPILVKRQIWNETINTTSCILGGLAQ